MDQPRPLHVPCSTILPLPCSTILPLLAPRCPRLSPPLKRVLKALAHAAGSRLEARQSCCSSQICTRTHEAVVSSLLLLNIVIQISSTTGGACGICRTRRRRGRAFGEAALPSAPRAPRASVGDPAEAGVLPRVADHRHCRHWIFSPLNVELYSQVKDSDCFSTSIYVQQYFKK
ncbi:hypothetical protein C8R46DRAFT_1096709 [Mycena filopes]|nr:hypothetical protein C8R46DRAFT_1096709 [Mycena filopes]